MRPQDFNNLAALLIEYSMFLSERDEVYAKERKFHFLKYDADIKECIIKLLEYVDDEY